MTEQGLTSVGMLAVAPPLPLSDSRFAGRYELLGRIASGGMGEVFVARVIQGPVHKQLALKLLLPHLERDPQCVAMFLDEARIAARMEHPNILPVFDFGEANGRPYIAMPLVSGVSLAALLKACRQEKVSVPLPLVNLIAMGLCEALAFAHEARGPNGQPLGVIHRDVTPSNIMVSTAGAVLLTDFGIAKAKDNQAWTRPGELKGKFAYMAPEQLLSDVVLDRRADIFSASVTLYELFTGVSPFLRDHDAQTLEALRTHAPPDARTLRPELSENVVDALMRGMARSADARFASALELRHAVIQGHVALPRQLGELVSQLCPEQLSAVEQFSRTDDRNTARWESGSRRSEVPSSTRADEAVPRRKRSLWWGAAAGLLLGAVGLVRFWPKSPAPLPGTPKVALPPPVMAPPIAELAPPVTKEVPAPVRKRAPVRRRREVVVPKENAGAFGYLSADAVPWAKVFLDGKEIETTPLSRYPLPVGRHVLKFVNPDLKKATERVVQIAPEGVVRIEVDLSP